MLVSVNTFPELINEWQHKFPDWGQNHLLWCGGCKLQETLCRDLEIPGRCDGDPVYKEMGFNRDSWRNIRGHLLNVRIQQAPWRKHRLVRIIITGLLPDSPLYLIVERFLCKSNFLKPHFLTSNMRWIVIRESDKDIVKELRVNSTQVS